MQRLKLEKFKLYYKLEKNLKEAANIKHLPQPYHFYQNCQIPDRPNYNSKSLIIIDLDPLISDIFTLQAKNIIILLTDVSGSGKPTTLQGRKD